MKLFLTFISLLMYLFIITPVVNGQQVFKLNSIDSQTKQVSARTLSGIEHQRQYYELHDNQIDFTTIKSGDYLEIEVTPGSSTTFGVNRVENYTSSTTSFITKEIDNPENTFTFTYSNGRLHGIFHKSHEETYFFEYDGQVSQNYVSIGSSFYDDEKFCSIHELDTWHLNNYSPGRLIKQQAVQM
ncbi:hypothetical protein [Rhodohalobacter sp.]|uniref:hypothetical protein n=1 Tax=Rhodohalobacter sp. TaxID=1974210 RepID=UPI002ACD313B|nr:hypothetical protein [Rhodohalobacter sp.]MDZ7757209.1 hypothetical protein [Rhodohalobacter sp.]